METAAARIVAAALGKQRVAVFADYDVDGVHRLRNLSIGIDNLA